MLAMDDERRRSGRRAMLGCALLLLTTVVDAAQWPELEAQLNDDPAAALLVAEALQRRTDLIAAQRAELHLLTGESHLLLTRGRDALQAADAGLALLPANPEQSAEWSTMAVRLHLLRALAQDLLGQSAQALPTLAPLLERLAASKSPLFAEALAVRGSLLLSQNDVTGALADLQQAYRLAPEHDKRFARADVASTIANVYVQQGDHANAARYYKEAIRAFQQSGSDVKLSIAVFGLGFAYRDAVNWPEARRHFGWSLELSRKRGDHQGVAYAQQQLAHIAIETGQYAEAQTLLDAAQPLFEHAEDHAMVINTSISRADLAAARGRRDEALSWLEVAEADSKQYQLESMQPQIWLRRAEIHAERNQFAEAYRAYRTFHERNEAVFRKESDRRFQELRVRFESEHQEQQNAMLQQQNELQQAALQQQRHRLWLYVAVALLSLLSTIFLLYVIYKGRQVQQRLDALAHTDELTGLSNRRHLMQEAQIEIARASRYGFPLCLAVVDLDNFKLINDRFGHGTGDEVLRQFARQCQERLRQTDLIGRIGGEEFVLLLPHTSLPVAKQILDRLRTDFKDSDWSMLSPQLQPTVSLGLTELQAGDQGLAELLRRADDALYQAKQGGRDQLVTRQRLEPVKTALQTNQPEYEKY